jgi:hypothetical protein
MAYRYLSIKYCLLLNPLMPLPSSRRWLPKMQKTEFGLMFIRKFKKGLLVGMFIGGEWIAVILIKYLQ